MKILLLVLALFSPHAFADSAKAKASTLICKTAAEKMAAGQSLKLYFTQNLPIVFEPEDPTVPLGRQVMLLAARPFVQFSFEKSSGAAGENGEFLQPMQCAFAKRALKPTEPSQVQIILPAKQVQWISQSLGQSPKSVGSRAMVLPVGDWRFASKFEQVFTLDLDDPKAFVTSQLPKEQ